MTRPAALAAALLSLGLWLPASASAAGVIPVTCPNGTASPLPQSSYHVGVAIPFFGIYTDFGNPGSVLITFTRSDGLTRSYRAFNLPDGSWMRDVTFTKSTFAGSWRVHIVVDQASGTSVCDGQFMLLANVSPHGPPPTLPSTDAATFVRGLSGGLPPAAMLVGTGVLLLAMAGMLLVRPGRRV